MGAEGQIAETLCEVSEELIRRKLQHCGNGEVGSTQTGECGTEGFNGKDATNPQLVKDATAKCAAGDGIPGGEDAAAAADFTALPDGKTRREKLRLKSVEQGKASAASPSNSWSESVTGKQGRTAVRDHFPARFS